MAVTRIAYAALNDAEIDAESPLTESVMFRLRDNWVSSLATTDGVGPTGTSDRRVQAPERLKTSGGTASNKILVTNGSGGFALEDKPSTAANGGESVIDTYGAFATSPAVMNIDLTGVGELTKNATIFFQGNAGGSPSYDFWGEVHIDASNNRRISVRARDPGLLVNLPLQFSSGTNSVGIIVTSVNGTLTIVMAIVNDDKVTLSMTYTNTMTIDMTAISMVYQA